MRLGEIDQEAVVVVIGAGVFDAAWYATTYPDVVAAGMDPLLHFLCYGWREGRDPSPLFSVRHYCESAPDVAAAGVNPLVHYLTVGWREGRAPRADFDPRAYVERHDVPPTVCPLVHEAAVRARAVRVAQS